MRLREALSEGLCEMKTVGAPGASVGTRPTQAGAESSLGPWASAEHLELKQAPWCVSSVSLGIRNDSIRGREPTDFAWWGGWQRKRLPPCGPAAPLSRPPGSSSLSVGGRKPARAAGTSLLAGRPQGGPRPTPRLSPPHQPPRRW